MSELQRFAFSIFESDISDFTHEFNLTGIVIQKYFNHLSDNEIIFLIGFLSTIYKYYQDAHKADRELSEKMAKVKKNG